MMCAIHMTEEQYLEFERDSDAKHELIGTL